MATFYIKAMYEYEGEVEADNAEEAEALFIDELDCHYMGTYSFDIEEQESDDDDDEDDE